MGTSAKGEFLSVEDLLRDHEEGGASARQALREAGIEFVSSILALSKEDLLRIPGLDVGMVDAIASALASIRLSLMTPGEADSEARGLNDKILHWLCTGRVGLSSKAMAARIAGMDGGSDHPCDPDDLNHCLLFLEAVPEARAHMDKLSTLSTEWEMLVVHWQEIERLFIDEVGLNWCKHGRAEKTYALMQKVLSEKWLIVHRLHEMAGVCLTCGARKCEHGSTTTTLPDTLNTDVVLRAINMGEFFFKE